MSCQSVETTLRWCSEVCYTDYDQSELTISFLQWYSLCNNIISIPHVLLQNQKGNPNLTTGNCYLLVTMHLFFHFCPFFLCYTKNGERSGGHMYTTGWQAEPFLPQLRQEKSELHRAKHLDRRTTASKERNWAQFYMLRFGTSHKLCTSELPKFAKSERCK